MPVAVRQQTGFVYARRNAASLGIEAEPDENVPSYASDCWLLSVFCRTGKGIRGGLTQRRLTVYSEGPAAECDALHGGLRMVMPSIWSH